MITKIGTPIAHSAIPFSMLSSIVVVNGERLRKRCVPCGCADNRFIPADNGKRIKSAKVGRAEKMASAWHRFTLALLPTP